MASLKEGERLTDTDPHEIYDVINNEISRLFGTAFVLTFVDARHSPLRLSFSDRDRSEVVPNDAERRLARCFADFREASRTHSDSPSWLCAMHLASGTKTTMLVFYEGDYDFALGSAELMRAILEDHVELIRDFGHS